MADRPPASRRGPERGQPRHRSWPARHTPPSRDPAVAGAAGAAAWSGRRVRAGRGLVHLGRGTAGAAAWSGRREGAQRSFRFGAIALGPSPLWSTRTAVVAATGGGGAGRGRRAEPLYKSR